MLRVFEACTFSHSLRHKRALSDTSLWVRFTSASSRSRHSFELPFPALPYENPDNSGACGERRLGAPHPSTGATNRAGPKAQGRRCLLDARGRLPRIDERAINALVRCSFSTDCFCAVSVSTIRMVDRFAASRIAGAAAAWLWLRLTYGFTQRAGSNRTSRSSAEFSRAQ